VRKELGFSFINLGKKYFAYSTDAPIEFGEGTLLSILGHAVGRETFHLIQPGAVFHNSYILLNGPSTVSRKTTAQELGQKIYNMERWLPNEVSPEKMIVNLSEKPEGLMWMGELSKMLKGISGHGYMATMAETYNDLFTCPERYVRDLMKGTYTVENAYLNLHSTITPKVLKENMTSEMFNGGLMPRWLIIEPKPHPQPRGRLNDDIFEIYGVLRGVVDNILRMKKDVCFEMDDEALAYYNKIEEDIIYNEKYRDIGAFAGRYENYIIAFADLYLISDAIDYVNQGNKLLTEYTKLSDLVRLGNLVRLVNSSKKTNVTKANKLPKSTNYLTMPKYKCIVTKEYVERAFDFVKPCLDTVKELAIYVDMDKPLAKTREYIKKHERTSRVNLLRNTNLDADKLDKAIGTLIDRQEIKVDLVSNVTNPNRKSRYYVWR